MQTRNAARPYCFPFLCFRFALLGLFLLFADDAVLSPCCVLKWIGCVAMLFSLLSCLPIHSGHSLVAAAERKTRTSTWHKQSCGTTSKNEAWIAVYMKTTLPLLKYTWRIIRCSGVWINDVWSERKVSFREIKLVKYNIGKSNCGELWDWESYL